ncbi:protein kinase [Micromonospora sp. NPDC049679]|uniref:serine/threonine-protein kinase n=1 Tax=Micromonospora sp. NPDC049679 TaxID=3155920 RepID=UPI0033F0BC05
MPQLSPGLRLHNRFTLVERVGVGGMSQVWRAMDEVLGRPVAVKVLDSALADDPALKQATWREARAAARLAHPHVIQVYDYGEAALPGGASVPYLVMELVEGESLAARLRSGPLPWAEAVRLGAQVAAALAAAHRLGVVHRDVKPGNVMLTPAGAKVLDFGIAALVGSRSDDGGLLVGTPAYAAPEQLRSALPQPASDVYGLGVLLYEALTARRPIPVNSWADAARAHRGGHAVPAPQVLGLPPAVTRLVMAALAADPGDRPSAEEMAIGLAAAAGLPDPTAALHDRTAALPMLAPAPGRDHTAGLGPARPPFPPTMIQPRGATSIDGREAPAGARPRRRLVVALVGAVAAAGLILAIVAAALPADKPAGAPQAAPPSAAPSTTTSAPPVPTNVPSSTTPTSPDAILAELKRVIAGVAGSGDMTDDAASELGDKIDALRDPGDRGRGKGKQRKQVEELDKRIADLQNKVDELHADGDVDDETANRLTTLLRSLSGARVDNAG